MSFARSQHAPIVVAHRGSGDNYAEHTLAGYRRAIEEGADDLECDVRLTADGHVVCVHDRTIDRTSTGSGVVSTLTLDELERHDFGSWWNAPGADAPADEHQRVLTLDRLLRLIKEADRPIGLSIETKHPNRYGGYLEERVVEVLHRYALARPGSAEPFRVRVMSFSEIAMRRMRTLAPRLPRVFLMEKVPVRFRNGTLPYGTRIAGPSIEIIRKHPGFVRRLHQRGNLVHVWTIDRMDDLDLCIDLKVDGVITNRPEAVVARLEHRGARRPT